MPSVGEAAAAAGEVVRSRPVSVFARTGLAARGVVYLLLGLLAAVVGLGGRAHVDQRGALTEAVAAPFGGLLVLLLAVGFAAYAAWRLWEAATGVTGEPPDAVGPRLQSLARGVVYAFLAVTALSVLRGVRGTQAGQQGSLAGDVMGHEGGRWAVALAGVVVVAAGAVMIHEGWSKKFLRYFGSLPQRLRGPVVRLGQVGTVARGVVVVVAGVLVVAAAWTADPGKAGGVDTAIHSLLDLPAGPALVVVLGAGLAVFGVYGLAEALWRRVDDAGPR